MTRRIRTVPAVAALVALLAATVACADSRGRPEAGPTPPAPSAPAPSGPPVGTAPAPTAPPATGVPSGGVPVPAPTGTAPTTAPAAPPAAPPEPERSTERRPSTLPPVQLPPRPSAAPGAREVVAAFRAAGLRVPNPRDRSVDCGPDGDGLGCSELIATDAVTVYVFPDETSAGDMADVWSGASYRRGSVVLNYLEARTPAADRPKYERVLAGLR
ncbi:hypothetical protein AWW66_14170 [Micromonospora rosaria]|uniref:Uncharacterized protein n=1 Tax=Micromonospora rosaria TaxID=47874 RepID=A0A136PSB8_9ACTN|nr:hypothetical protein [Micromonospora rosaria]KXK61361.1 hypothetical protein AWW66_14170 [Micromonospora rosaria]